MFRSVRRAAQVRTTYLFSWSEKKKENDWRADGYRWSQNSTWKKMKCPDGEITKLWFYVSTFNS